MTITEFLLARITEDEAEARKAIEYNISSPDGWPVAAWRIVSDSPDSRADHYMAVDPTRVLAECEAKRRIVALAERVESTIEGEWNHAYNDGSEILEALASVYADHPDFREEWRTSHG